MSLTGLAHSRAVPLARRLAALVSTAVRVEPALLRAARLEFLPQADPGVEADVWLAHIVEHRGPLGVVFEARAAHELRAELASEAPALYERAWILVERLHRELPPELRLEEEVAYLEHSAHADRTQRIEALLGRAISALRDPARAGLARWAARALPRFSAEILERHAARLLADGARLRFKSPLRGAIDQVGELSPWAYALAPEKLDTATLVARLFPGQLELVTGESREGGLTLSVPATEPIVLELRSYPLQSTKRPIPPARKIELPAHGSRVFAVERGRVELLTLLGERHLLRAEPVVYVSYAPADDSRAERLRRALAVHGIGVEAEQPKLERRGESPASDNHTSLERASVLVAIASPDAMRSHWLVATEWPRMAELSTLHGVPLFVLELGASSGPSSNLALSFPGAPAHFIPWEMPITEDPTAIDKFLADVATQVANALLDEPQAFAQGSSALVERSHLPRLTTAFFGRAAELHELNRIWEDASEGGVLICGSPSSGKTALVREWLSRLEQEHWRGAELVFAWSFDHKPDVRDFIAALSETLGLTASGSRGSLEAMLGALARRRFLLVLDGLREEWLQGGGVAGGGSNLLEATLERILRLPHGLTIATATFLRPAAESLQHLRRLFSKHTLELVALHESEALSLVLAHQPNFAPENLSQVLEAAGADTSLLVELAQAVGEVAPWALTSLLEAALAKAYAKHLLLESAREGGAEAAELQTQAVLSLFRRPLGQPEWLELEQKSVIASFALGARVRTKSSGGKKSTAHSNAPARGGSLLDLKARGSWWLLRDADGDRMRLHPGLAAAVRAHFREKEPQAWRESQRSLLGYEMRIVAAGPEREGALELALESIARCLEFDDAGRGIELYLQYVILQPAHLLPLQRLRLLYELQALPTLRDQLLLPGQMEPFALEMAYLMEACGRYGEAAEAWRAAWKAADEARSADRSPAPFGLVRALLARGELTAAIRVAAEYRSDLILADPNSRAISWDWLHSHLSTIHNPAAGQHEQAQKTLELVENALRDDLPRRQFGTSELMVPLAAAEVLLKQGNYERADAVLQRERRRLQQAQSESSPGSSRGKHS